MAMADKPENENFSDDPLKPWENREVRKLLRDEARVKWLWSTLRLWGYYISAFVAALVVFQENIIKIVKRFFP